VSEKGSRKAEKRLKFRIFSLFEKKRLKKRLFSKIKKAEKAEIA